MKKISIIIPVYNSQKYIEKCIESVLAQDFGLEKIEIVLVNDGSTDRSLEILKKYKKKYSDSITIVDQKNSGVAKARYNGTQAAVGEYITFMDNDDFLDEDYFSRLYNEITAKKCDIIISGYRRPDKNGNILFERKLKNNSLAKYKNLAMWGKLYRSNVIKPIRLDKFNNSIGEDVVSSLSLYNSTKEIIISEYVGYNWFMNMKSVSNDKQKQINSTNQQAISRLFKGIKANSENLQNDFSFKLFLARNFVFYSIILPNKNDFRAFISNIFTIIKLVRQK